MSLTSLAYGPNKWVSVSVDGVPFFLGYMPIPDDLKPGDPLHVNFDQGPFRYAAHTLRVESIAENEDGSYRMNVSIFPLEQRS